HGVNLYGDAKRFLSGDRAIRGTPLAMLSGTSLPWSFCSSGLGSNVSTCDGPPPMNRKMTLFAYAGECVSFDSTPSARSRSASARRGRRAGRRRSRRDSGGGPYRPQSDDREGMTKVHLVQVLGEATPVR